MAWPILAERPRFLWRAGWPAGPLMLAFCIGVGVLQGQPGLPQGGTVTIAVSIVVSVWLVAHTLAWRPLAAGSAVVAAGLFGFVWADWRASERLADDLPLEWERRDIELIGVIAELPREFERGRRFVFEVEAVATPGVRVPRRVLLSWFSGSHEDQWLDDRALLPGERWRFTVRLKRPHGHANPGGFDYEAWLLERNLRATGYVRAKPGAQRLGEVWTAGTAVERGRAVLRQHLQKNLGNATFGGVIVALALGDQGSIAAEHWRVFAATGTTHLMSISGLHVTMLAALAGGLVSLLWRRWPRGMLLVPAQRVAVWTGWLAALAYTLLAGAGIPAVRTLLMLSVAALTHTLDRRVAPSRVLLLALFAVLLVDPWAVLVVGFWLSFAAVAVLLWFADHEADEAARRDETKVAERSAVWFRRLRQWGWAQWVVTVGTVPLVLVMFQSFSIASPLANALAIPLVGLLIAPLAVAAALLPVDWLAPLAHTLLGVLMFPLEWLAAQPWAVWRQGEVPVWVFVLAVAGVLAHLTMRAWPARLAPLLLLMPLLLMPVARPAEGTAWIDVLDVGHGLSVVVRTARRNLLFDAGPRYSPEASAGERMVLPALRAFGIDRLDALVVSHRDNDHVGGAYAVAAEIPLGWLAGSLSDQHPLRRSVAVPQYRCQAGQAFVWDGVVFRFLSPPAAYYALSGMSSNRMSCVLRIEASGRVALLTGDAEAGEEVAMLAAGESGPLDVLQVPHQGSRSSSSAAFVAAARPALAIVPAGYRNPFGHPHPEVIARYRAVGAQVLQTDRDGAVHVELGRTMTVVGRREYAARYWAGR